MQFFPLVLLVFFFAFYSTAQRNRGILYSAVYLVVINSHLSACYIYSFCGMCRAILKNKKGEKNKWL